jgi:hypothetical protein
MDSRKTAVAGARGGNSIHPIEDASEKPINVGFYRNISLCFVRFLTVIPDLENESEITWSKLRRKTPAASEARRRSLESRSVIITITCAWTTFNKSRDEKEKHLPFPFEI